MRQLLLFLLLLPMVAPAQQAQRFQRALASGKERALDRWMKRELHHKRKGCPVATSQDPYIVHSPTFDTLVAVLRSQPGVEDAAWDKCIGKGAVWPGLSNIGLRWRVGDMLGERCWSVQEGVPGTINLFGWRPKVRKDRSYLKYKRASDCPGFVEQQRTYCEKGFR